jgi:hypothetical protein
MFHSVAIASALGALVLGGCSRNSDALEVACEVARVHASNFQREAERPIAVWTQPSSLGPSSKELDFVLTEHPELKQDPQLPLYRAAAKVQRESPVARCSHLREWLTRADVLTDDRRIKQLTRGDDWPIAVLSMSMPGVSADGSTALLFVSEYWGPLGGNVDAVIYKKDGDGSWVIARRAVLEQS